MFSWAFCFFLLSSSVLVNGVLANSTEANSTEANSTEASCAVEKDSKVQHDADDKHLSNETTTAPPNDDDVDLSTNEDQRSKFGQIHFFLNLTNGSSVEIKIEEPDTVQNVGFHKGFPLRILIHGFMGSCYLENFPGAVIKAYKRKNTTAVDNLLCVDWSILSGHQNTEVTFSGYQLAVENTIPVGERLAQLIEILVDKKLTNLRSIHIIGFSLGAHVAGTTGYFIHKLYAERIGRITGLDPAGPFFHEGRKVEHRLDKSDADYVDIVHTNGRKLGIARSIGHIDFYPNGGKSQPQCKETGNPELDLEESVIGICSHVMAPKFFVLSINGPSRMACKSSSWPQFKTSTTPCSHSVVFGDPSDLRTGKLTEGNYYLDITEEVGGRSTRQALIKIPKTK